MNEVLTISDVALRLALATIAGSLIGLERENHGRAAGLRTTVLVCIAAAVAMILSDKMYTEASQAVGAGWRPDPARLAAGILTGMGFLGAGVIMKEGRVVRGVTTAAALWITTIIGLTIGAGLIWLGLAALGLSLVILFVLPYCERFILNDWYGTVEVTVRMDGMSDSEIKNRIEQLGVEIKAVELNYDLTRNQRTICCRIKYKKGDVFELSTRVVSNIIDCEGVVDVKWV